MEEKKYELLKDDTIVVEGYTLYRIKALKDFGIVKKDDLGGYIEKEDNLSQDENCWVYDDARVYGNARVSGSSRVSDNARVYGNARVFGDAYVFDHACVYDYACVYGDAWVFDNACVSDNAYISNDANISSDFDYCTVSGFGSKARTTTFFKCKNGVIKVNCGCFNGTINEFRDKVKETHGDNKYAKEYLTIADIVETKLCTEKEDK